jgi:hypothetical protein
LDFLKPLAEFLREVGFPIFVACYLMIRLERTIHEWTLSNHQLREALQRLFVELENRK